MASKVQKIQPETVLTVGLDIGYGVVKAVTRQAMVTFPSVCGHARDIKFQAEEISAKYTGDQITDDEGTWFVGDLAQSQLPPGELFRLRGRTANELTIGNVFRVRMAKVALGKLLAGAKDGEAVHIRIATGLPVDHMRDAAELKDALMGQHFIKSSAAEVVINVVEVMVMPQPYGTIYANTLTAGGEVNPCHNFIRTGVCDVGTYTVDLALDDDGEYVDAQSGSVESGVYTAHERISALLERTYRQKLPFKSIEETLRTGCFRASGETVDYTADVREALEPLRSATLNLMSDKWKTGTTVDVIYLSGGGASLVQDVVSAAYHQTQLVKDAQIANARGYLHYALFAGQ